MNTIFSFPTVKSIIKPGSSTVNPGDNTTSITDNSTNNSNNSCNNNNSSSSSSYNINSGGTGLTPLLLACANGQLAVVRELIWRHCSISAQDAEKSTALHHLARAKSDSASMFKELKKRYPAEVDALMQLADFNGDTPLLIAIQGDLPF